MYVSIYVLYVSMYGSKEINSMNYVCMYVCMYVYATCKCMYVVFMYCMYVCIYVSMYGSKEINSMDYVCMYVCIC